MGENFKLLLPSLLRTMTVPLMPKLRLKAFTHLMSHELPKNPGHTER